MLHRFVIAIGIIGGLAVAAPRAQEAVSPRPQPFRTAVDLVTIQASVRDARGRVVTGLTTTDFEVRDNGQLRPILSLRSDRQSPLSVAILVDMSYFTEELTRLRVGWHRVDCRIGLGRGIE